MKKLAKWLIVLMTVCLVALSFVACDSCGTTPCEHTYDMTKWESDDTDHWHPATCEHKTEKGDKAAHTFVDGVCSVCKKEQPHEHTFDTAKWETDGEYHWHAATCGHTSEISDRAKHTFENGKCKVCERAETEAHEHTFSESWNKDGTHHWHDPLCQDTDEKDGYAEHDFGRVEISVLTCTTDGVVKFTCKDCGYSKSETEKAGHSVPEANHFAAQAATCEEAGNIEYWECERCNKLFSDSEFKHEVTTVSLPAGAHEYETVTAQTYAATCTTYGVKVEKCKHCGDERKTQESPKGHIWNQAKTCTEGRQCTVEGCEANEPALGHSYALALSREVSCTHDGEDTYICELCRDSYKEITASATGHNVAEWTLVRYSEVVTVSVYADINVTEGTYVYVGECKNDNCSEENNIIIETNDDGEMITVCKHDYGMTSITPATCSVEGTKTYTCTYCNNVKEETFADTNAHAWNDGVETGGITTYTCTHNSEHTKTAISKKSETSAAVDFDLKSNELELANASFKFDDTAADSVADKQNLTLGAEKVDSYQGYDNVYNLTMQEGDTPVTEFGGGEVTVSVPYELGADEDPEDIAILYINENGDVERIKARFVNGFAIFETTHFSYYTVTRLTPKERCDLYGHNLMIQTKAKTCITDGYTLETCLRCGDVKKTVTDPATGHTFTTTKTNATCTTAGSEHSECSVCHYEIDIKLPATGHHLVTKLELGVKVSCARAGVTVQVCDNPGCNVRYTTLIAQLQHDYETVVTPATCTKGGYTTKTCKNNDCGHFAIVTDYTPATGHNYALTKHTAATCNTDGVDEYKCSGCDKAYTVTTLRTGHTWDMPVPTCGKGQTCLVCNAEGLAATGEHTMADGVCSVCGMGCKHTFIGTQVAPTCTLGGYTLKTCSECGQTEKADFKAALGHDGTLECSRCHEALVGEDFHINMLRSIMSSDYTVKLENLRIADIGFAQNVVIKEFYLGLDEDGELCAYGYGSMTDESVNSLYPTSTMGLKVIVQNGMVYFIGEQSGMSYGNYEGYAVNYTDTTEKMYAVAPVEKLDTLLFGNDTGYATMVSPGYKWLRNDLITILDTMIAVNKDALSGALRSLMNRLYTVESTAGGYTLTLSGEGMEELLEIFEKKTLKEALNEIFGADTYDKLMLEASDLLDTRGKELAGKLATKGVDIDKLLAAAGNLGSIIMGEDMTASELLSGMLDKEISIEDDILKSDELIYDIIGELLSGEKNTVEKQELLDMLESYLGYNLYYHLSVYSGTDEETIIEAVKEHLPMIDDMTVVMTVDKNGYLKSGALSVDCDKLGDFTVTGSASVLLGNTTVYDYESLRSDIKRVTDLVKLDNAHFGAYWINIGAETEYYGDEGEGNIRSAQYTETREYIRNLNELRWMGYEGALKLTEFQNEVEAIVGNNYTVMLMERYESEVQLEFEEEPAIMLRADCGNWYYVNVSARRTSNDTYGMYVLKALGSDGSFVKNADGDIMEKIVNEGNHSSNSDGYMSTGLEFFINGATGEIRYAETDSEGRTTTSVHNYVEDESKFVEASGCTGEGTRVLTCTECGNIETHHFANGHGKAKGTVERAVEGETVNAQTCANGIKTEVVCLDCNKVIDTRTVSNHERFVVTSYSLVAYGASESCGGRFVVHGCLCGKERGWADFEYSGDNYHDFGESIKENWTDENNYFRVYACSVTDPKCNFRYSEKVYSSGCEVRRTVILGCDADGKETSTSTKIDYLYRDNHYWSIELSRTQSPKRACEYEIVEKCARCGETRTNRIHAPTVEQLHEEEEHIKECYYAIRYICNICGSETYRTEEYRHAPSGHGAVEPTCTQYGMSDICGRCGVAIDLVNPTDHKFAWNEEKNMYVCSVCGLENTNGSSGRIWLEDRTESGNDEHVVGYFDLREMLYRDWYDKDGYYQLEFYQKLMSYRYQNEFEVAISIVFDRGGNTDTSMLYGVNVYDKTVDNRLGCYEHYVAFSMNEARNAAQNFIQNNPELNITEYSIRLSFVPKTDMSNLDYGITFDSESV